MTNNPFGNSNADPNEKPAEPEAQQRGPAGGHDKFGETRPQQPRVIDARPYKIAKACKCNDHIVMEYSLELEMPKRGLNQLDMIRMAMAGEEVPMELQWVPTMRVLASYN